MLPDPYWPFYNPAALCVRNGSALAALAPRLKRVATVAPLVSFAEARLHLKLDPLPVDDDGQLLADADVEAHPDDALVRGLSLAVQGEIDGPNSWTHRGAAATKWQLSLRGFPSFGLVLPLPPVRTIDSVTFREADGTRATVDPEAYRLGEEATGHAVLSLAPGIRWPDLPAYPVAGAVYDDAVQVTFTTGYEDGDPDLEMFKAYAKLRLGQFYENREAVVLGTSVAMLSGWENMLENLRVSHPDYLLGNR